MSLDVPMSSVADWQAEGRKLGAFLRRDVMVLFSYRTAFAPDILALAAQATMFFFVQKMVDSSSLPSYEGTQASYLGFVAVGIALGAFMQVGLGRIVAGIRNEQLLGTLESLFMTPTRPITIQVGLAVYDLFYVPVRTLVFLLIVSFGFGVNFELGSLLPVLAIVMVFIPIVWGIGMAAAATILTFRRGGGLVGIGAGVLTVGAGAYFPLALFPSWVETIAELNPVAVAFEAARSGLIGGAGWADLLGSLLALALWAVVLFSAGLFAFGKALSRERRHGTMSLY